MLDATNTTSSADTGSNMEQSTSTVPSRSYSCTSCEVQFEDGQQQRQHMKEQWHIYNIKRRVESLPPVSRDAFESEQAEKLRSRKKAVRKSPSISEEQLEEPEDAESSEEEDDQDLWPHQCLFCSKRFEDDDDGFTTNLDHMRAAHGMTIPDIEKVEDVQSFIGYLATGVRVWHECLYCGATKPSTLGIQGHMRDKGHCMINLDREPELLEFWERSAESDEEGRRTNLSATEMRFASGKIIGSKHAASATKRNARRRSPAASTTKTLPPGAEDTAETEEASPAGSEPTPDARPEPSSSRQLVARRSEMSVIGISDQQRHALVLAEKKAQRSEDVARRAREWVNNRTANTQKYDQIDGKAKHGKQNHKLQPR